MKKTLFYRLKHGKTTHNIYCEADFGYLYQKDGYDFYIAKNSCGYWNITEKSTGLGIGRHSYDTIKAAQADITDCMIKSIDKEVQTGRTKKFSDLISLTFY